MLALPLEAAMNALRMIDLHQLDELARRLANLVPPPQHDGRDALRENFKIVLRDTLGSLGLVSRTEFELQRVQLALTRDRLTALEAQWGTWRRRTTHDVPRP